MSGRNLKRLVGEAGDATTLLGEGGRFSGDFSGTGSFIVGGEVIGDCDLDGALTLAEGGRWKGNIRAREVVLAGVVDGEVIAEGALEVTATARVTGSLTGAEISVAEGAVIDGGVHVTRRNQIANFTELRADE